MNAAAPRSSASLAALLLARCAAAWARGVSLLMAVPLGTIAAVLAARGKPEAALLPAAFAVAALWAMWFSRLLLLHIEARQSRVPGLARAIGTTLAGAGLATVALPAVALAWAGATPVLALSALAVAALGGLLFALLPAVLYLLLCFAPLLLSLLRMLGERLPAGVALPHWQPHPEQLPGLALALAVLAAWRWQACLRDAAHGTASTWGQPMIAVQRHAWSWNAMLTGSSEHWRANLPDWLWPAGQAGHSGPARPVRAIRSLLGTPFAPLAGRQRLIQFGFGALVLVFLIAAPAHADHRADVAGLAGGVLGGGAVLVLMYGQRLEALRRRRSGELDELALLPGWSEPARARGLLLRAVAWSPALAALAALAVLLVVTAQAGLDGARLGLLGLAVGGIVLTAALACLRPLAGQCLDGLRMLLVAGPGLLLAMFSVVFALNMRAGVPLVLVGSWLVAYAALGSALFATWRRFVARPHPFLQQ